MKRSNDKDYKRLAKMLAKWRKKTTPQIYRMGKEEGIRWDYLLRVEDGKSVTAVTLLAYLHYCHSHGYNPLSDLWPDDTPTTTVDSPTSGTVDGSADGSVDDVDDNVVETSVSTPKATSEEEEKEEHKGVYETSDSGSETTPESTPSPQLSVVPQYNKLYHDNTSDETTVETSDSVSASALPEVTTEAGNEVETPQKKDSDIPSVQSQIMSANKQNIPDDSHEGDISDDDEKQLEKFNRAMDFFDTKQPLDEDLQRAIISFGHQCPKCGKNIELKKGGYIGHCSYVKECNYYAKGTLNNPIIIDKFRKSIIPIDLLGH